MEFKGQLDEYLLVSTISHHKIQKITENTDSVLSIYWNKKAKTSLIIDNVTYVLEPNQLIFLTEYHKVDISNIESLNVIKFNRIFYCIGDHDSEIGCKGILFFGASQVPIISLNEDNLKKFELLWTVFQSELSSKDELQMEMLQMLLKRFLILSTRIYKELNPIYKIQESKLDLIIDYNYLVEVHYKTKHTVSEYAALLNKPAKSLSNLFAQYFSKSPLQIIQDRIILEAKRILIYSEKSIKETAFELGFEDLQSFSRFFKNKEGISPKDFRDNHHKIK
jgi:AraC family transcriptional regulator, transcriptional activator of pobA